MKTKTPKRKGPARVQYRHTVAFSAPILPPGPVIQPLVAQVPAMKPVKTRRAK